MEFSRSSFILGIISRALRFIGLKAPVIRTLFYSAMHHQLYCSTNYLVSICNHMHGRENTLKMIDVSKFISNTFRGKALLTYLLLEQGGSSVKMLRQLTGERDLLTRSLKIGEAEFWTL